MADTTIFDAVIIGGGAAGLMCAIVAGQHVGAARQHVGHAGRFGFKGAGAGQNVVGVNRGDRRQVGVCAGSYQGHGGAKKVVRVAGNGPETGGGL